MKELTTMTTATMSSLEIAEITGKRHDHILRDIRNMLKELDILAPQIWGTRMVRGKEETYGNLDKELTMTLITGYSIKLRNAVIKRWQELEARPQVAELSRMDLIQLAMDAESERLLLEQKVKEDEHKVEHYDRLADSDGLTNMSNAAAVFGMGRTKFFQLLREMKIIQVGKTIPYNRFADAGYFKVKEKVTKRGDWYFQTFITPKGMQYLSKKIAN